ncbi:MAG TPA: hypothetical protein VMV01_18125, partial [Planctomycetota bacterium]|nr:hypothetical protein [Planctomycetota bacterium]
REPQQALIADRRDAAARAEQDRLQAAERLAEHNEQYQIALRDIEGLEGEVETARGEVLAGVNAATALRHSIDSAAAARERIQEGVSRLDVEETDLRVESERLAVDRLAAEQGVSGVQRCLEDTRVERVSLETGLAAARAEHAVLAQELRTREHDLAGLSGRLRSLEELEAARAGFTEAARVLLAQANGRVEQRGAVADYLEVDRQYERAVEALLGDLLQHVVVPTHEHAAAGVQLLREQQAGRCGFVVLGQMPTALAGPTPQGVVAVADLVRISGPDADLLRAVVARGYVAESWDAAVSTARATGLDVATLDGELARGGHVVVGGGRQDARGILATKGEIKEVRARVEAERDALADLALSVTAAAAMASQTQQAIEGATARLHQHEKSMVAFDAQLGRAREEGVRLDRKGEMLTAERRRAEDEIARLEARQAEARQAIAEIESRQVGADERFTAAQQQLSDARNRVEGLSTHVAEAKAAHAGLVERAAALVAEVARLEEAARELAGRVDALTLERTQKTARRLELEQATTDALGQLDAAVASLDGLRADVRSA